MRLFSIGVDHRTSPVEVREKLAFDAEQATRFLGEQAGQFSERLLLSTCNRTELLAVPAESGEDPTGLLVDLLGSARGMERLSENGHAESYRGEEALRHLLRVACGLESMVLGETQITGQLKEAGEVAEAAGAVGPVLRRALDTALRVAKRARTETSVGEGAVSAASASVELARKVYGDLEGLNALVVGAGETGRLVAQHLRAAGVAKMLLASRTIGRAREVASEVDAEPAILSGLPAALRHADIVVTSTAAETPILTHEEVRGAMRVRKGRMLLVLDIAVPRDVEESVGRIEGVLLHDIDALGSIVDTNLEVRRRAVPKVEAMVEEAVRSFLAWERQLEVVPSIKALRERLEEIRQEELAKNLKRVPENAREQAARLTESLLNRILHAPTTRLRKAGDDRDRGRGLVAALRDLFGIGEGRDG
ncbi:MAG: glutamyl-tRNA reductase [Planctomycetota bacterium]|jgi:glutamyl-tRNA reductase